MSMWFDKLEAAIRTFSKSEPMRGESVIANLRGVKQNIDLATFPDLGIQIMRDSITTLLNACIQPILRDHMQKILDEFNAEVMTGQTIVECMSEINNNEGGLP